MLCVCVGDVMDVVFSVCIVYIYFIFIYILFSVVHMSLVSNVSSCVLSGQSVMYE